MSPAEWFGFEMVAPREPLREAHRPVPTPVGEQALVEVVGCGICHTDLGFLDDGVRTRHPLPLVLGHEIAGVVREAPGRPDLVDRPVVVPAVLPCGVCADCRAGRPMICKAQVMPGNDADGGFASHVVVPTRGLCPVPAAPDPDAELRPGLTLRHLAVIADAVSTPYQALRRAEVGEGDVAVVIGLGGVGGYAAQLARALGAAVIGIDVDARRLETATADLAVNAREFDARALKEHVRAWVRGQGLPATRWTVLECSGTVAGQRTAWELLVPGATLCVVGYTLDKVEVRLSNLMALDARAVGNWGCDPALYPEIVDLVLAGRVDVTTHTELRPLATVTQALDDVRAHRVTRRLVLVP